jgi:nucleoside-diphosphate-sugar epimerase
MRILVTGTAGYVGAVLAESLAADPAVEKVVATDRVAPVDRTGVYGSDKLSEETGPLEDTEFVRCFERFLPFDAVIHSAFAVRAAYGGKASAVASANIESCRNIFDFSFQNGIGKLIYFSSAAVYGAKPDNRLDRFFTEEDPLREETYPYGLQKRQTEELLRAMYEERRPETRTVVVRPCSITGPRFLASPTKKITLVAFLKKLLPVIPEVSAEWSRQYIHEDDLVEAIMLLLRAELSNGYETFNLAPHDYLTASEIAQALGKRTIKVSALLMSSAMNLTWHLTRGRMPTPPGSVDFYRYPINLDGRKITKLGFAYRYGSRECLLSA